MSKDRKKGYMHKFGEIAKGGAATAVVLYPATKLVWALDSAAKNVAPVGLPNYARTPMVTLALAGVAALLPANYWTEKIGEMVLAAGLIQTTQQYGQTVPGQPGTIDAFVNKGFQPIANLGIKGYTTRLQGYIEQRQMAGYTMGAAADAGPKGAWKVGPMHPNDQVRRSGLRGYQAEHVGR